MIGEWNMKRKINIIILLIICISSLSGCGQMSVEDYNVKEKEFYLIFEEIAEELYPTSEEVVKTNKINKDIYSENENNLHKLLKVFDNEQIPKEKKEDYELIYRLKELTLIFLGDTMVKKTVEKESIKYWQEYIDLSDKIFKKYGKKIEEVKYANNPLQKYMDERNIKLTAKDVQYNMENNVDKCFVIEGIGEIDDYYNYGFDDMEKDYFCVRVEPTGGKYSDEWYLYFHRESFEKLFNQLKQDKKNIMATCKIPEYRFEISQGNMAIVEEASW